MHSPFILTDRRRFIATLAVGAAAFTVRGAFAEELARTPAQTEGPFYPDKLPLDTDNDLLIINDAITPAVGEITHLTGRILDAKGSRDPQRRSSRSGSATPTASTCTPATATRKHSSDKNFQGFGRFLTGSTGEYYFRTIKPVPYPGRTPHIHFKVKKGGRELLTTQCYIKGHPGNEKDGIWSSVTDPRARESITIDFNADQGLEDRRAGGEVRHRARADAGSVTGQDAAGIYGTERCMENRREFLKRAGAAAIGATIAPGVAHGHAGGATPGDGPGKDLLMTVLQAARGCGRVVRRRAHRPLSPPVDRHARAAGHRRQRHRVVRHRRSHAGRTARGDSPRRAT